MIWNDRLAEMWLLALAGRLDTKSIGLFRSFQLHFESLHSDLKPVHRLYRGLSTRLVVVAYESCDARRTHPLTTHHHSNGQPQRKAFLHHWIIKPVASLRAKGGRWKGGGPSRVTPSRGVTPERKKLWLNLQRTVDKGGRTNKKCGVRVTPEWNQ